MSNRRRRYLQETKIKDKKGTVEFKAYFLDANEQAQIHTKNPSFIKSWENGFLLPGKSNHKLCSIS